VEKDAIERGQVLAKPGSITPHTEGKAEIYVLTKEEGGRHTPFFNGYRPQFYFRTTDVTGILNLPEGVEMVMPGDNLSVDHHPRQADRDGGRSAFRHPRRRPHHRCRADDGNHEVRALPSIAPFRGGRDSDLDSRPPRFTFIIVTGQ
jgi:hypothetical protein